MHLNWLGIISAILAIAAFLGIYLFTRNFSSKSRVTLLIITTLAAIPGASFAIYYAHLIEVPHWYYQFRSLKGTELLLIPIGIASGLLATFLPRPLVILPLLGSVAFTIVPFLKPLIGPISDQTFEDTWNDDICLQSTPSTCGAASTATILNHLGHQITEKEIARAAYSYTGGTEAWYLVRAIRAHGVEATFHSSPPGSISSHDLPAIIGVKLGDIGHFIPVLSHQDGYYLIGDPLRGPETMTLEALRERYELTGFQLHISSS